MSGPWDTKPSPIPVNVCRVRPSIASTVQSLTVNTIYITFLSKLMIPYLLTQNLLFMVPALIFFGWSGLFSLCTILVAIYLIMFGLKIDS